MFLFLFVQNWVSFILNNSTFIEMRTRFCRVMIWILLLNRQKILKSATSNVML